MVHSAPSDRVESQAATMFAQYGGEDKEVDAYELGEILNTTFTKGCHGVLNHLCPTLFILCYNV